MSAKQLVFKQIAIAPWDGDAGRTYSVIALSEQGRVYRYDAKCDGWVAWSTTISTNCAVPHKR